MFPLIFLPLGVNIATSVYWYVGSVCSPSCQKLDKYNLLETVFLGVGRSSQGHSIGVFSHNYKAV